MGRDRRIVLLPMVEEGGRRFFRPRHCLGDSFQRGELTVSFLSLSSRNECKITLGVDLQVDLIGSISDPI